MMQTIQKILYHDTIHLSCRIDDMSNMLNYSNNADMHICTITQTCIQICHAKIFYNQSREPFVGRRLIIYLLHIGHGTDEVGAPSTSEEVITRRSGAQCAQNNRNLPCQDKKCFCCIGGRTHDCYYTLHDCKAPASKHKSRSLLLVYHVMAGNVIE